MAAETSVLMRVLLVEDNPGDARLIRAMLAEAMQTPLRLVHVERLAAALERLRQPEPDIDIVLLDLGLPDSQGLDTFLRLRASAPQLPIAVLSGQTDASVAVRAVREGAQDYLLKGHVDPEVLVRALRYAIEHKRSEERQRFLSEASRGLASSLDYQLSVEQVVHLPVPFLAEACVLHLEADDRSTPWVLVHDLDPAREQQLGEASERLTVKPPEADAPDGMPAALCDLGFGARLVVPLAAHGRLQGALWLLRTGARPAFSREDAALADELALRAALALDNARVHRELHVAVKLRDEVLASASHDLRGPLSGIKLQDVVLRRLLRAHSEAVDAELHERVVQGLDEIDAATTRSLALIQELLDAAALQAGRQLQLERQPIDLVALARRAVAEHQARTDFHQLRLEVAAEPLVGDWDAARLGRVLDNLLSNALKYSPRPDVITVSLAREAHSHSQWAVLRIQDHGLGIPASELRHVFDRFFRGSNVPREVRGAGIGLAGVRQIVEQHAGRISVDSREGVGTTFTVRLPLGPA